MPISEAAYGRRRTSCLFVLAVIVAGAGRASASSFDVLYNFNIDTGDYAPLGGVSAGPDGTLYGTSGAGGPYYNGAVYRLSPPAVAGGRWARKVLHFFTGGADGQDCQAAPILGADGLLYGTATMGGAGGYGVVYRVDPKIGAPSFQVVWHFTGRADGGFPWGGLALGPDGALYGTTTLGYGGVFRLQAGATSATLTPLHSFQKSDGDNTLTLASPFVDANGNVFGVTYAGGPSGHGVVFELTPPPSGQSGWTYTILHAFTGGADGGAPDAALIGNGTTLYGTASAGGARKGGAVFALTQSGSGWNFSTLYNGFNGIGTHYASGYEPVSTLLLDASGALYGTTVRGGLLETADGFGYGVIFRLNPPAVAGGAWSETVVQDFTYFRTGTNPQGNIVMGPDGAIYGMTQGGGPNKNGGAGTIYRFAP